MKHLFPMKHLLLAAALVAAAFLGPAAHAEGKALSRITLVGSVTSWGGGAVTSSADGSNAKLCLVYNNLNPPAQEQPAVAPVGWAYLFLPPTLTVDARYTPAGVYSCPVAGWTLVYVALPALPPCGGRQWTIPLLSGADEPGEIFAFRRGRWGWAPAPGAQDVGALPAAAGH